MAERESPFADEWRDCLREHYKHVIRDNDTSTEETLTPILQQVGFREDELNQLKVLADPSQYRADAAKAIQESAEPAFKVHPAECTCAACIDAVIDDGHDDEGQPLEFPEEPDEGEGNIFQVEKIAEADEIQPDAAIDTGDESNTDEDSDDDSPMQRSLF